MSVKSTVTMTRADAEERYLWLKDQLEKRLVKLTDDELEEELERMNDAYYGGEGFENYRIL